MAVGGIRQVASGIERDNPALTAWGREASHPFPPTPLAGYNARSC